MATFEEWGWGLETVGGEGWKDGGEEKGKEGWGDGRREGVEATQVTELST